MKLHVSMSLDGFTAGPDVREGQGMGAGGSQLHEWLFADPKGPVDAEVASGMYSPEVVGAVVMGRRHFDVGIGHWGDDGTFGVPCFVVTSRPAEPVVRTATTFTFVTRLNDALDQARAVAGAKEVKVMGADVGRQLLAAGAVDEVEIDLVPVVLGGGTSPFAGLAPGAVALQQVEVRAGDQVTHLRYRLAEPGPAT